MNCCFNSPLRLMLYSCFSYVTCATFFATVGRHCDQRPYGLASTAAFMKEQEGIRKVYKPSDTLLFFSARSSRDRSALARFCRKTGKPNAKPCRRAHGKPQSARRNPEKVLGVLGGLAVEAYTSQQVLAPCVSFPWYPGQSRTVAYSLINHCAGIIGYHSPEMDQVTTLRNRFLTTRN